MSSESRGSGTRRRMKLRSRDCSRLTTSEIRRSCSSAIGARQAAFFTYGCRRMKGCGYCRTVTLLRTVARTGHLDWSESDDVMKAVVMERYGTPDVLELRDVATPTPKADEVLVRVHAASLNDWDWGLLRGTPFILRILNGLYTPKVQISGCDSADRDEA